MSEPLSPSKNQVLFVGARDDFEPRARTWLKDFADLQFVPSPPLDALTEVIPPEIAPKLILLDGRGEAQTTLEWTQTLKMAFNVPLVVFYDSSSTLEFAVLRKNGADVLLHIYYDAEFIIDKLIDLVSWDEDGEPPLGLLNPLAIEDLSSEMDLNFDLYVHLPGNQKSILVRRKGGQIDAKLIDKVKTCNQNVYFKKTQMKLFLEYSRTLLSLRDSEESMGVTDKVLKTRQRIQEIISQFFDRESKDYAAGKIILENCEKILEDFEIKKWSSPQHVVRQIVLFTGRPRTFYNDAITLCILNAALGYLLDKKPEEVLELAIAGLLHNVGLAALTNPALSPELDKISEVDKTEYLHYPERSVVQIKGKKVPLPPSVSELILQHREKISGGGFPKGSDSSLHHPLSRIMQLAVELMLMTQLENNKPRYTLKAALAYLHEQIMAGNNIVDGTMLLMLKKKIDTHGG